MVSKRAVSAASLAALTACAPAPPATIAQALHACAAGARHAEIAASGRVVRVLGERRTQGGDHEGFIFAAEGRTYKVEDNVDITGPVPLRRGDAVALQGQFECDDYVIHWTHRDLRGRHPSGYIDVNGRRYQ